MHKNMKFIIYNLVQLLHKKDLILPKKLSRTVGTLLYTNQSNNYLFYELQTQNGFEWDKK